MYNIIMIKQFLKKSACAACKGCCYFDGGDAWEMPYDENADFSGEKVAYCPSYSEKGCVLGAKKPFECALYPFRIMKLGEFRVIAVARYCPETAKTPLSELCRYADENAREIAEEAAKHPGSVKNFKGDYIILKVL